MKINEILKSDIKINFKYIFLSKLNLLKKIYRRIKFNFDSFKFKKIFQNHFLSRKTKRLMFSFGIGMLGALNQTFRPLWFRTWTNTPGPITTCAGKRSSMKFPATAGSGISPPEGVPTSAPIAISP